MNMNLDKFLKLKYIYLLSIVYCLFLTYLFRVDISFDTPSYINAWSTLQECQIDKWRTPVYPLFLGMMSFFFGDYYLYYVVGLQHVVFLISIRYFYCLMRYTVRAKNISFFITLFYALYPCVATYNCCIATETFAVTGSVFLMYSIYHLYKTKQQRFGLYTFFWLFFLIFLRPAVVYLLPVTIVGWCIVALKMNKEFYKPVAYGIAGSVAVSILLVVYMGIFKANYGVFTPSGIGLMNKYAIAKAADAIDFKITEDNGLQFYQEVENGVNTIGMESFSELVNQSINRNKVRYAKRLLQNVLNASEDDLFKPSYSNGIIGVVSNIMGVKIKVLYILLLIYIVILLHWWKRNKNVAFFSCLYFMIGVSNYIIIIIASPGEYGRLLLPSIPVYLIMFGQLLNMIKFKNISEVNVA